MDYGAIDSVLSIIEYMQFIGKEASVQLLRNPKESELGAYDKLILEDLIKMGRADRMFGVAFQV